VAGTYEHDDDGRPRDWRRAGRCQNPERRAVAELIARVGARVAGEHRHPGKIERFTVLDGELTVKRSGETFILRQVERAIAGTRRSRVLLQQPREGANQEVDLQKPRARDRRSG
jgi:ribosomal protein S10